MLTAVSGAWADASGSCGTAVTWSYVESTQTLTISGTGAMADYNNPLDRPWIGYVDNITSVVIGSGVTKIGICAFNNCENLTTVTFDGTPTLTSIGDLAFIKCSKLASITLPAGVTSIGMSAFDNCTKLESINIPAGVSEGMVVNVPGKGNAGRHNGVNGDIQVLIKEEPNDTFIRNGQDLYYTLLLDLPTAILGGEVDIPTISGNKISLKIDPGTQPGKQVRLRGKGLPAVQGYGRGTGDIIVNISVYIPKTLTKEEKEAVEVFKESDNFKSSNADKKSIFEHIKNLFS